MKLWIERALAGFCGVGKALSWLADVLLIKWAWYKLEDLHYDPPPVSLRKMVWIGLAVALSILGAYWYGRLEAQVQAAVYRLMAEEAEYPEPEPLPSVAPLPDITLALPPAGVVVTVPVETMSVLPPAVEPKTVEAPKAKKPKRRIVKTRTKPRPLSAARDDMRWN
jgi:hypothetical protein